MEHSNYKLPSGHEFTVSPLAPIVVYTESEVDAVDPGKFATDSNGNRFLILKVQHVTGRLYRVEMIQQA